MNILFVAINKNPSRLGSIAAITIAAVLIHIVKHIKANIVCFIFICFLFGR